MNKLKPLQLLLDYYDLYTYEEFEIENRADSPYHFNGCGSLCNKNNEIRNEILFELLTQPELVKRSRKYYKEET